MPEINDYLGEAYTLDGVDWVYDLSHDGYFAVIDGERKLAGPHIARKIRELQISIHHEKELSAIKQAVDLFGSLSPMSRKNVLAYINQKFSA